MPAPELCQTSKITETFSCCTITVIHLNMKNLLQIRRLENEANIRVIIPPKKETAS